MAAMAWIFMNEDQVIFKREIRKQGISEKWQEGSKDCGI
ncbi:hypothetical protein SAMN04490355_101060 [Pelosinus propionicus DSM 13327]|uniref:Uncharacterized protein n=1 Tax=Pelosinus propionicus DSM 13327 TaxID=1123291 RepID=A0A1I4J0G8_9FIRM|nr:hypothetical protein SAMN04490355_101060 [Pelosinus propionicus DSM 13327]